MGEEPFYSDIIINKLIDNVLTEQEKEFNQVIMYGSDTTPADIVSMSRKFPMFAEHQLIIIKEAQSLTKLDPFELYFSNPSPETILVLSFNGKGLDKRGKVYSRAKENAIIFESTPIKEWEIDKWITSHINKHGYKIEQDAARLMAEHTGNSLRKIDLECSKLFIALGDKVKTITTKDIERNSGISKEFSAFELCNALSKKDLNKAFKIAYYFGSNSKKYHLTLTICALFF